MLKLFKWLGFEKKSYVFPTCYFVCSFTLLYNNEEKKIETYFDIPKYSLLVYEGSELLMTYSLKDKIPDIWAIGMLIDVVIPYYVKKSLFKTLVKIALGRKWFSKFKWTIRANRFNPSNGLSEKVPVQPMFKHYQGIDLPPMIVSKEEQ